MRAVRITDLDAVLEAVELQSHHVSNRSPEAAVFPISMRIRSHPIALHALSGSRLTSQQLLAIWQPAWPTIRVQSQHSVGVSPSRPRGGQGAWGSGTGVNIPFKLMTSRMVAGVVGVMWLLGGGEVAADSSGGGGRW